MSDRRKHDSPTNPTNTYRSRALSRNRINRSGKSPKQILSSHYVRNAPHARSKDLQTPKRQAGLRYTTGLNNNADSPGEGDGLHDIIWDPISPTARSGKGLVNTKVFQISDIVNRIAPKDAKPVSVDSSLLQWIGDSAVPCTPEENLPRARRTLKRKSSVDELMHLARQFDINMQQGQEDCTERIKNNINNNVNNNNSINNSINNNKSINSNTRCGVEHKSVTMATGVSSAQQVEAELNALFDGPTQRISGRFSQSSSASTFSQEGRGAVRVTTVAGQVKGSEVKPGSERTACTAARADDKAVGVANSTATRPEATSVPDDDWEDDDLLNDPFVLEITQNPTGQDTPTCEPCGDNALPMTRLLTHSSGDFNGLPSYSVGKGTSAHSKPLNRGDLTGPCPKPPRSTFTLEPNPCFLLNTSLTEGAPPPKLGTTDGGGRPEGLRAPPLPGTTDGGGRPKGLRAPPFTGTADGGGRPEGLRAPPLPGTTDGGGRPEGLRAPPLPGTTDGGGRPEGLRAPPHPGTTDGGGRPDRPHLGSSVTGPSTDSPGGQADRVGSSPPSPATDSVFREISDEDLRSLFDSESLWKDDPGDDVLLYQVCDDVERVSNSQTVSVNSDTTRDVGGAGLAGGPVRTYNRSNSEPGARRRSHLNVQSWTIPARAGSSGVGPHPLVSCNDPNGAEVLGKFTQLRDAKGWGAVDQGSLKMGKFPAKSRKTVMPNPNTSNASLFQRQRVDSAVVCNAVPATSEVTGRCTAAEIERKKQEAIARRKSRQTSIKPVAPPV
ncbi:hypothetical protein DPEC_G00326390 [Dallia pectoralis]|uniref:Uncharacterized protein n=1 Tax=Dallia pectoralis TaxID=75939 RepID=A0ACC2F7U7_DALPE|nr:hypothetical protein DPEC_G00326390 [Dallia pectoralis]